MNRLLAALVAATVMVVVTGCAGQDPTRQTLNEHVDSIRDAAATGDLASAQRELEQLQSLVRQAVEQGELDQQRADAILAAAAAVDQELSALAQPPDPPPTTGGQPPDRDDHEHDERDEEDKNEKNDKEKEEKEEEREKEEPDEDEGEDEDD